MDSSHRKTKAFADYKSINGRANNLSEPIVKAGTIFKGGDAVAVVVGSEVKNGERRYMVSFAPDKESAEAKLFFGDKWLSESELQQWLDDGRFAEYKGVKVIRTDHQGNPVNADGSLLLEKIGSIDELTDGDFLNASRRKIEKAIKMYRLHKVEKYCWRLCTSQQCMDKIKRLNVLIIGF